MRGKAKQYNRMINVLWYCYLISNSGTQLEVAEMLGVSDSLVSDYRKRIESISNSFPLTASTKPDILKKPCVTKCAISSRSKKKKSLFNQ